jgi:hypothetical protein
MPCQKCERLEREHAEARARFDAAGELLDGRIAISLKDEFVALSSALDQSWEDLVGARVALDRHVREHGSRVAHGSVQPTFSAPLDT